MDYSINYKGHYIRFTSKKELVHFLIDELWGEILDFALAERNTDWEQACLMRAEKIAEQIEEVIE